MLNKSNLSCWCSYCNIYIKNKVKVTYNSYIIPTLRDWLGPVCIPSLSPTYHFACDIFNLTLASSNEPHLHMWWGWWLGGLWFPGVVALLSRRQSTGVIKCEGCEAQTAINLPNTGHHPWCVWMRASARAGEYQIVCVLYCRLMNRVSGIVTDGPRLRKWRWHLGRTSCLGGKGFMFCWYVCEAHLSVFSDACSSHDAGPDCMLVCQ